MSLSTDKPFAPMHLDILAGDDLPQDYEWGAYYSHPSGACYYVIRTSDHAAVIIRRESNCQDVLQVEDLAASLQEAMEEETQ